MKTKKILVLGLLAFSILNCQFSTVRAQGTAFTYQGQLKTNDSPANGNYDFTFALYNNNNTNSGQAGNTLTNLDVNVNNGLFIVTLDFGGVFTGANDWLAIGARSNGAANFTALNPLQEVTPAPYALYAHNAGAAASVNSVAGANVTGILALAQLPAAVITNGVTNLTVGSANEIAPLTVPPTLPSSAIGSVGTGNDPSFMAIAGRYVYVVNRGASTLQVFDVSNPSGPVGIGSAGTDGQPQSVAVAGRYAYVVNAGANTMQIIDVGNPSTPVSVGSVGTSNAPYSVAVAGHYTYVVDAGANTFQIFDVGNPAAPVNVGSATTGSQPQSVAVAGRYAYVANYYASTLQVFDVDNPAAPVSVGSIGTGIGPYFVAVAGRYAYVVNYNASTLQVFDVNNPAAPVSVGSVGTSANPISAAVAGRYAYVASIPGTLQVFDLGGAYLQQFEAGAMETGTLQTRDTVTVGGHLNARGGLTASGSARISGGLSVDNGTISGSFTGNGAGLTNLNAASFAGTVSLPAGAALLNSNQVFTGDNYFSQNVVIGDQTNAPSLTLIGAGGQGAFAFLVPTTYDAGTNEVSADITAYDDGNFGNDIYFASKYPGNITNIVYTWLAIADNGNVGIGIVPPVYALDVDYDLTATGVISAGSDRNAKENFAPIRPEEVLEKVTALPITEWNFKKKRQTRHIGPMAQDFYAAFGVGPDDRHIATEDESGVELAAIQGLNEKLEAKDAEIQTLQRQKDFLAKRLNELETMVNALAEKK